LVICSHRGIERATQNRLVALFRDTLKYTFLGNFEDRPQNSNVEKNLLIAFLKEQGVKIVLIDKVIFEPDRVAGDRAKACQSPYLLKKQKTHIIAT
jgi:type I restriction enzyme R subunit